MFITVTSFYSGEYVIVNSDYIIRVDSDILVDGGSKVDVGKILLADPRKMLPPEGSDPKVIYTVEHFSELERALRSVPAA
ncbi:MAG: hypothetical protein J6Y02_09420 [Pseudobutyrivibrio sp.]|nr:hypothetical protein [Pseudobutyrivibrio sp.]